MTYREMEKLLLQHGWKKDTQKGSHAHFVKHGQLILVPNHPGDMKKGLALGILKDAGIKRRYTS